MVKTHVLQEDLEDTTSLLVDETRDTLYTTTTSETTDSLDMWMAVNTRCNLMIRECMTYGLGDTLDVVTENLTVTLGTTPRRKRG